MKSLSREAKADAESMLRIDNLTKDIGGSRGSSACPLICGGALSK